VHDSKGLSVDARFSKTLPPFFEGRYVLAIVVCTAVWGPMRLREIENALGKTIPSYRTGGAARFLEKRGICVLTYRGYHNITVELDRRHPYAKELRRFARKLYKIYFESQVVQTPLRRGQQIRYKTPAIPKRDPASLDLHIFGDDTRMRVLHLLAEAISVPAFALRRLLGTSRAIYKTIRTLEEAGIVRTIVRGNDLYVRLDRSWPAHMELWLLLRKLNRHLPEYAAMAAVNRGRRRSGEYSWVKRLRRALGRYHLSRRVKRSATARRQMQSDAAA
jgi:DNA-binding transcriptional ArsR family regulator